jgi:tripartite-type tricarboxylate transporter receptor subunit TctC
MSRNFTGLMLGAALAAAGFATTATAQDWPSKTISMVVPYAAGGGTDVIARAVAQKMQNRAAAVVPRLPPAPARFSTTTAAAQAAADGYTVLISNIGPMAVNPSLFKNLRHDPVEVLEPVTLIAKAPLLLLVHPSVKANTVQELIALAKAQPEGLTYGTAGHGSANHIATALFELMAKVSLKHAPYRGAGPALNDLIGGHIPMMFATLPSAIGHVSGGNLKALAVTTLERAPALPNVPTLSEAGVTGYEASGWYGVFVRKGTPRPIIDKLRNEVATIINLPEVRKNLELEGAQPIGNTPEEFGAFVKAEREKWSKVVTEANIKVE